METASGTHDRNLNPATPADPDGQMFVPLLLGVLPKRIPGPEAVIVVGYHTGNYEGHLTDRIYYQVVAAFEDRGYPEDTIRVAWDPVEDALVWELRDAKVFAFIGHASDVEGQYLGSPQLRSGDPELAYQLDALLLTRIMETRGDKPFEFVWLAGCYTKAQVPVWAECTSEIWTYRIGLNLYTRYFPTKIRN